MQSKIKLKIFITVICVALLMIFINYFFSEFMSIHGNLIKHVYIRDVLVKAEVVKSKEKIELGLGGRENLPEDRGMLFVMPKSDTQHFWMKGMRFAIDIIWIENGRVIGCEKNISPDDDRIFSSPDNASYVLEVTEGFCEKNKVQVNDEVRLQ